MLIRIDGENYRECERYSSNCWANKKKGAYGGGIINSDGDPHKVERVGALGEMAFSIVMGLSPDFSYRQGGDKEDFVLPSGKRVDVKTAAKNYGCNCVKFRTSKGNLVMKNKEPCDVYVGCYIVRDDRVNEVAEVEVVGYITKEEFDKLPEVDPRARGSWKNKELVHSELRHIKELESEL